MRKITLIIVHYTANRAGSALRMADIDRYHRWISSDFFSPWHSKSELCTAHLAYRERSLGWKGCGYHYVIPTDGTIEAGRPEEMVGAHCKNRRTKQGQSQTCLDYVLQGGGSLQGNHNRHSIGVAYVGGLAADGKTPCDTRTLAQKRALRSLLEDLHKRYPKALIVGHCDLEPRKPHCPEFDVHKEFGELQP